MQRTLIMMVFIFMHTVSKAESTSMASGQEVTRKQEAPIKLNIALRHLFPLAAEWENIGVFLDIPDGELSAIKKDNSTSVRDCLREMLKKWITHVDPRPTWAELADAVEPFDSKKAEEIRKA